MAGAMVGCQQADMRDAGLQTLVEGFEMNTEMALKRGERLVWLLRAVAVQTFFVVLVQVAAAVDGAAAAGGLV